MENLVKKHRACSSHCCIIHGCKYGYKDCPVCLGVVKQEYLCECCFEDEIQKQMSEIQLWNKIDKLFIKKNRKLKLNNIIWA